MKNAAIYFHLRSRLFTKLRIKRLSLSWSFVRKPVFFEIQNCLSAFLGTFGSAEDTPAQQNPNKFAFALAYSYLGLRREYSRSAIAK